MKYSTACFLCIVLLVFFPVASQAHKVNVFAFADGDTIQVECYFSKKHKVKNGKLVFTDIETGATIFEGTTDEQGIFGFRPDADFLKTGHGLNILLNAGEGHQNNWRISPEELAALSQYAQAETPAHDKQAAPVEQSSGLLADSRTIAVAALDAAELETIIGRVMDAKLVPIKQTLARHEDGGPTLNDIIGGLGWIIGLLGLAAYMKFRR